MKYVKFMLTARNVLFFKRTEDFFKNLLNKAHNPKVTKYIKSNLRNWLINSYEEVELIEKAKSTDPTWLKDALDRGDEVYNLELSTKDMQAIEHWIDYLNTVDGDISRISIPQLKLKVKEWEKSFAKQKADEEDGIELIHKYPDGYSWVQVFGKNSLNREGRLMNHCVGSYYNEVKDNKTTIYSLRDKNNKPHCTIELRKEKIEQIKGNSNQAIKDKYVQYVRDFLKKKYVDFKALNSQELLNVGLIEINQNIYPLDNLPEGLEVGGNLDLAYTEITSLPKDLKVKGNLDLRYSKITSLSEGLKIGGSLYLEDTEITSLPKGLKVGGSLYLDYTEITSLPEGLEVGGNLYLAYTEITSLPDGLKVGGQIYPKSLV